MALGTVNNLRQEVSEAVAEPVAEATVFAQAQAVANADETGWAQGNSDGTNPERRKAWLWVMVTTWVTVFQLTKHNWKTQYPIVLLAPGGNRIACITS